MNSEGNFWWSFNLLMLILADFLKYLLIKIKVHIFSGLPGRYVFITWGRNNTTQHVLEKVVSKT